MAALHFFHSLLFTYESRNRKSRRSGHPSTMVPGDNVSCHSTVTDFAQIAWLIDITTAANCDLVWESLALLFKR